MKVKICGLKTAAEAMAACEAGADLIGFNFHPESPRYIEVHDCARLVQALRGSGCQAILVGVFVNRTASEIRLILEACDLDLAQLSGNEPARTVVEMGARAFKVLRPQDKESLEKSLAYYPSRLEPPAWLLDAYQLGKYGGTGQTANWGLAADLASRYPILLAGGLTPDNVAQAVRIVKPWGVDVSSGVEAAPGRKDPARIRAFIQAAREPALKEDQP
jgi:phosphoribosylanthranilate isomerase